MSATYSEIGAVRYVNKESWGKDDIRAFVLFPWLKKFETFRIKTL